MKFNILDALATILLMWGENDIDDVNNTPRGKYVQLHSWRVHCLENK